MNGASYVVSITTNKMGIWRQAFLFPTIMTSCKDDMSL